MLGYQGEVSRHHIVDGMEKSLDNAETLLSDAESLLDGCRPSLAYYLAVAGLEEIGKFVVLLEAYVLCRSKKWKWDVWWREDFRDHRSKFLAAFAQCFRGPGSTDPTKWDGARQSSFWERSRCKPPGRETLFKKPRSSVLDQKDASIYVEYNPDLDGGRFIAPFEIDIGPECFPDKVRYFVDTIGRQAISHYRRLVECRETPAFVTAADAAAAAYEAGNATTFPALSKSILELQL